LRAKQHIARSRKTTLHHPTQRYTTLLSAMGDWLLAMGYWLWAIGYWLWAIGYWLWAMGRGNNKKVKFFG